MDRQTLLAEHQAFENTCGVSANNWSDGFRPAFLDKRTGEIELSRNKDGSLAPYHLIDWLPHDWGQVLGCDGAVKRLRQDIVAGFERDGTFYTREQLIEYQGNTDQSVFS